MNKIRVVRAYTIYVRVKVGVLLGRLGFRLCVVWIYSARAKFVRCVFDKICAVHVHILFIHSCMRPTICSPALLQRQIADTGLHFGVVCLITHCS